MQSNFGASFLFGIPPGSNRPVMFGAAQSTSVDISFDLKMLYGQYSFALEQARGKGKIDMKASMGRIDPDLYNNLFFGQTESTGQTLASIAEATTVAASVVVANAATFKTNLGVYNPTTGKFLQLVASAPATGQYAVNAATGTYTFATADVGTAVKIYYTYGNTTTGTTITGTNSIMDSGPIFQIALVSVFRQKTLYMHFPAVQASKLSFPMKQDDFTLPELDMSAQDDGAGNVFDWSVTG